MMNIQLVATALQKLFEKEGDAHKATKMASYMRDKFRFYGLQKPERQKLARAFWKDREYPDLGQLEALVEALWDRDYRELHYHALDLLERNIEKLDEQWIPFLEGLVVQHAWWDSVDFLAPRLIGKILLNLPEKQRIYAEKWIAKDSIWLQRTVILFQLKYKKETDVELLFDMILKRADSKEFFVQKGSGWALREYSKIDAEAVTGFVKKYEDNLAKLTKREGLKWLKRKKKD